MLSKDKTQEDVEKKERMVFREKSPERGRKERGFIKRHAPMKRQKRKDEILSR